jgi:phosphate transport system protein
MDREHTDREYEAELARVRDHLLHMAGLVEAMIADAVRAFLQLDHELAEKTVEADQKVNRLEMDTDELCLLILAKRQPLASDLRFITIAMKMVTDLERIGDLAVNIAQRALAIDKRPEAPTIGKISEMGDAAGAMLREAIDAFVARDTARARSVWDQDDLVDRLYMELCADAQAVMQHDPEAVERGVHIQAVAKFLERIGDHANNLGELVVFMVQGKDVRHHGKLDDHRRSRRPTSG